MTGSLEVTDSSLMNLSATATITIFLKLSNLAEIVARHNIKDLFDNNFRAFSFFHCD